LSKKFKSWCAAENMMCGCYWKRYLLCLLVYVMLYSWLFQDKVSSYLDYSTDDR